MDTEACFEVLRSHARGNRMRVHDVAHAVVDCSVDPVAEKAQRATGDGRA